MTTKLALDLPDSMAQALADKHHSGDLHEAAAHALTIYLDPTKTYTQRNRDIRAAVMGGQSRGAVAKRFNLSLIRVHQIMAGTVAEIEP
jgi:DNA-binding NarL/FixJ family response regulator